jgi:phosphoserine aminotransferase
MRVEHYLDALKWAERIGRLPSLVGRADANLAWLSAWVKRSDWAGFLAGDPKTRSNTSVCLKIVDPWFAGLAKDAQGAAASKIASLLEKENVALDIGGYRSAPPGLRIWCGATVETSDIEALTPWLDWAFAAVKNG